MSGQSGPAPEWNHGWDEVMVKSKGGRGDMYVVSPPSQKISPDEVEMKWTGDKVEVGSRQDRCKVEV